jgi:plastocyanin
MSLRSISILAISAALIACSPTSVPPDTGGGGTDAGHDAAASTADTGSDANSAPTDTGPQDCAPDFATCSTFEDHTADTTVTINVVMPTPTSFSYSPHCIRVHAGTMVTITNSVTHPLRQASCSPTDSPLPAGPSTATAFTFDHVGHYGFWCMNHGSDDGMGMSGLIVVE